MPSSIQPAEYETDLRLNPSMAPDDFLRGRTALVTGATGGIGSAIALSFAGAGMHLLLQDHVPTDRDAQLQADLLTSGAASVQMMHFNLADHVQSERGFATMAAAHRVDVLANVAGIQRTAEIGDMTRQTWDEVIAINLSAAFDSMSAFLPGMKERGYGRVINISSVHGLVASKAKAAYVSAKHGLIGLTKVAALECASIGSSATGGVTVNAICPGWVQTPLIEGQIQDHADRLGGNRDAGIHSLLHEKEPSLRMTEPADIGSLALFLCQPQAHNITGAAMTMDGGWTAV